VTIEPIELTYDPDAAHAPETPWHGRPVTLDWGELRVILTPRALVRAPA